MQIYVFVCMNISQRGISYGVCVEKNDALQKVPGKGKKGQQGQILDDYGAWNRQYQYENDYQNENNGEEERKRQMTNSSNPK